MKVDGRHTRTIWVEADGTIGTIDQDDAAASLRDHPARHRAGCGACDQIHAGARRAA